MTSLTVSLLLYTVVFTLSTVVSVFLISESSIIDALSCHEPLHGVDNQFICVAERENAHCGEADDRVVPASRGSED